MIVGTETETETETDSILIVTAIVDDLEFGGCAVDVGVGVAAHTPMVEAAAGHDTDGVAFGLGGVAFVLGAVASYVNDSFDEIVVAAPLEVDQILPVHSFQVA